MIRIVLAAAAALMAVAPAAAADFTGPRIEARVGADSVEVANGVDAKGVTYGLGLGYDFNLLPGVVAGVEATAAKSSADGTFAGIKGEAKTDFEAGARVGVPLGNALVYGRVAYAHSRFGVRVNNVGTSTNEDGYVLGGGVEFAVSNNIYLKAEYNRTDYGNDLNRTKLVGGVGFRF